MRFATSIILYGFLGGFLASQGITANTWQFYLIIGLFIILEVKTAILKEDDYVSIN